VKLGFPGKLKKSASRSLITLRVTRRKILRRVRRYLHAIRHSSTIPVISVLIARKIERRRGISLPASPFPSDLASVQLTDLVPHHDPRDPLIPSVVFQTWKSRTDLPSNYKAWRSSFQRINPQFLFPLWDDSDNRNFIERNFPWFLSFYDSYPQEIYRADAVRPFFLYYYGGFYADMDTECLRPLDDLRARSDVLLGRMGFDADFEHSIPNAIMASRPRQLFWLLVIKMMMDEFKNISAPSDFLRLGPEFFTGPILLKRAVERYTRASSETWLEVKPVVDLIGPDLTVGTQAGKVTLLGSDEWYAMDWTNPIHWMLRRDILTNRQPLDGDTARDLFKNSTMVTYWSHTW